MNDHWCICSFLANGIQKWTHLILITHSNGRNYLKKCGPRQLVRSNLISNFIWATYFILTQVKIKKLWTEHELNKMSSVIRTWFKIEFHALIWCSKWNISNLKRQLAANFISPKIGPTCGQTLIFFRPCIMHIC